ncbi:B3 domain-containing protein-like [Iris pallida]|nr:B3 domain-containing protein-like [Iris pallida]
MESVSSELRDKMVPLTGNPYFTSIVTKTQLQRPFHLWVPRWFGPHLPAASGNVVLTCRGRSWGMWYDRSRIRRGWKQFALDNDLKVGDGCVYELTDAAKLEFRVQILDGDVPPQLLGAVGRSTGMPMMID